MGRLGIWDAPGWSHALTSRILYETELGERNTLVVRRTCRVSAECFSSGPGGDNPTMLSALRGLLFPRSQPIPDARFGENELWIGGGVFKLAAEIADVDAQLLSVIGGIASPNSFEQVAVCKHPVWFGAKCGQKREFGRRQM